MPRALLGNSQFISCIVIKYAIHFVHWCAIRSFVNAQIAETMFRKFDCVGVTAVNN